MASSPDRPADLAGADLAGTDLAGTDLAAVLADPRLRPLWEAAHRRLAAAGRDAGPGGTAAHLRALTPEERAAIDRLLGVRSRAAVLRVRLDHLDARLQDRLGVTLAAVVTDLIGPLRDRPAERAVVDATWARLAAHPAVDADPSLLDWLASTRWKRIPDDVTAALDVLHRLPQPVRGGRSRLAAQVLRDAHALDPDRPAGRLVLSALAFRAGIPAAGLRAAERRRLWAEQGILSDETSSTVLTLGLRPRPAGPLTEAAARWADGTTPLPVPLVAVQAEPWRVAATTLVSVCENPSVLAAAAGAPDACMVCVQGRPSLAATLLLRSVVDGGARLRYHGDFGAGGISIANGIIGGLGAEPWRMGTADFRSALERARGGRSLAGPVPDACWDPQLAPAVRAAGIEVEEEVVVDLLLSDLATG